jgi:BirA family biotin operon repressor/biotin-[acetyl-CoA-carboxylase] ligase
MARVSTKPLPLLDDYHLLSYDTLDSTNEEAKRLAAGGASHGAFIWAKRQTDGRGRMGREWASPEGNLYVSVLLSPPCAPEQCPGLSFVAAVAVAETLASIVDTDHQIALKWPNDIIMDDKKLGGILLESFTVPDMSGQEKHWVVVGVGVNIDSHPEHVLFPATSLKDAGLEIISAKIVLSRFIEHFARTYDIWAQKGFAATRKAWLKYAWRLGNTMQVASGDTVHEGVFSGMDERGQLQLTSGDKTLQIVAGDVRFNEA